jgi:hypothetical protein
MTHVIRMAGRALLLVLATLLLMACVWTVQPVDPAPIPNRDPLVPTPLPAARMTPAPTRIASAGAPSASDVPVPALSAPYSLRWRMGAAVPDGRSPLSMTWPAVRPGWYLNWSVGYTSTIAGGLIPVAPALHMEAAPLARVEGTPGPRPSVMPPPRALHVDDLAVPPDEQVGMHFVPLVWVDGAEIRPPAAWLAATAVALPGRTWLIGNEPDVKWQSNATPAEYAAAYHLAYTTLKAADPTAQVAIGGISQVTPLRLAYLDAVLEAYRSAYGEEMPVDVWNIHVFVLQEKADDWGVDIPPGLEASQGELWTIDDHDDLALVEGQIRRMRTWLVERGRPNVPLWISEYGILMPAEYGFDVERVRRFMLGSFDLFLALRDPVLGYAPDEDRLVQRWMWFSTDDVLYPTGNLFAENGSPTTLMDAMSVYLAEFGAD